MACLPQLGSVPAAHAVVAGGCDWPLPPAVGLSNNDVTCVTCLTQGRRSLWDRGTRPPQYLDRGGHDHECPPPQYF